MLRNARVYTSVCVVPILEEASNRDGEEVPGDGLSWIMAVNSYLLPSPQKHPSDQHSLFFTLMASVGLGEPPLCLEDPIWQVRIVAVSVTALKHVLFKEL